MIQLQNYIISWKDSDQKEHIKRYNNVIDVQKAKKWLINNGADLVLIRLEKELKHTHNYKNQIENVIPDNPDFIGHATLKYLVCNCGKKVSIDYVVTI